jgi:RimJ/RimL family protein N-acetyltransferase
MTDEPAITHAIDFLPTPFMLADAQQLIGGGGDGMNCFWGVWFRQSAALVGAVGAHLRGADEIEIGYWLASSVHGRGVGSEAASSIVNALTAAYPARRIVAECRPQNVASWRLLERIGFAADGRDGLRAGRKRLIFG